MQLQLGNGWQWYLCEIITSPEGCFPHFGLMRHGKVVNYDSKFSHQHQQPGFCLGKGELVWKHDKEMSADLCSICWCLMGDVLWDVCDFWIEQQGYLNLMFCQATVCSWTTPQTTAGNMDVDCGLWASFYLKIIWLVCHTKCKIDHIRIVNWYLSWSDGITIKEHFIQIRS